jgi:hypothetical protein
MLDRKAVDSMQGERTPNCRCAIETESTHAVTLIMRHPMSDAFGETSRATTIVAGSSGNVKKGNSWW